MEMPRERERRRGRSRISLPFVRAMQTEGRKKGVSKNSENRGARVVPCEALMIPPCPPVLLSLLAPSRFPSFICLARRVLGKLIPIKASRYATAVVRGEAEKRRRTRNSRLRRREGRAREGETGRNGERERRAAVIRAGCDLSRKRRLGYGR